MSAWVYRPNYLKRIIRILEIHSAMKHLITAWCLGVPMLERKTSFTNTVES